MKKLFLASALMLTTMSNVVFAEETSQALTLFMQNVRDNHVAFKRFDAMDRQADAQAQSMRAYLYNPEISFEGENKNGADDTRVYGITQTIDVTGKNFAQKRVGRYLAQAQKADISQQRADYLASVIKAIAEYEAAQRMLKLAEEQAELMGRFTEIGEKRDEVGDVGSTELALARLAGAQAQSVLADATASWETAQAELSTLCDCSAETTPKLGAEPPVLMPPEAFEKMVVTLPSYRAAQLADEAAKHTVGLKKRERVPDPTFNIGAGSEGRTDLVTFGLSIPIPVLNTGSSEVREAAAISVEKGAVLYETQTRLLAQLKRQFRVYAGHQKALSSWRKLAQPSLNDYTKALEKQWNAGELSASDYLLQVKQGIETAMTGAEIKSHAWHAWANWMALTGDIEEWVDTTNLKEIK